MPKRTLSQHFARHRWIEFEGKAQLAQALAERVAGALAGAVEDHGHASLAVSGGSTPKLFLETLGDEPAPWAQVAATLVDERFVPPDDERSNHRLVAHALLQGQEGAAARFLPLWSDTGSVDEAAAAADRRLADLPRPLDVCVLGMGNDGHTASFFPGGDTLAEALTAEGPTLAIRAPGAGEPRITFTLPRLLETDGLYLHIEGEEKARVLDAALGDGAVEDMPIRAVLRSGAPISVYWCP